MGWVLPVALGITGGALIAVSVLMWVVLCRQKQLFRQQVIHDARNAEWDSIVEDRKYREQVLARAKEITVSEKYERSSASSDSISKTSYNPSTEQSTQSSLESSGKSEGDECV